MAASRARARRPPTLAATSTTSLPAPAPSSLYNAPPLLPPAYSASIPLRRFSSRTTLAVGQHSLNEEDSTDSEPEAEEEEEDWDAEQGGMEGWREGLEMKEEGVVYRSVKKPKRSTSLGKKGGKGKNGKLSKKTKSLIIAVVLLFLIAGGGWIAYKYGGEVYKEVVTDFFLFPEVKTPRDATKAIVDAGKAVEKGVGGLLHHIGINI